MDIGRRRFLQGMGGCAAGLVLASTLDSRKPAHGSSIESFTGNPDRFGSLTDTTMCIGCRLCEVACAEANGLPVTERIGDPAVFETLRRPSATTLTVVNRYSSPQGGPDVYRKIQCMHCDEPACVSACLVGALKKTKEGPVIYKEDVCIGCRYCMTACPFNALSYEYNEPLHPRIIKCILCYERVAKEGGITACAEACPTKGTIFGKRSDMLAIARKRIQDNPGKYVPKVYGEADAGGTGWLYLSAVPFEQLALPSVGTTPFPEYTRDWLLGVPVVLMLWPALLMGIHTMVKHKEKVLSLPQETQKGNKADGH